MLSKGNIYFIEIVKIKKLFYFQLRNPPGKRKQLRIFLRVLFKKKQF